MDEPQREKKRECYSCGSYNAFYTKGFCRFDKMHFGRCARKNETVEKRESCEYWMYNYHRRKIRKGIAAKSLAEMQKALEELTQIFAEDIEEEKENPIPN